MSDTVLHPLVSPDAYLRIEVNDAVVTVSAYSSDSQRQATKDAWSISGLDVLRIVKSPIAGATAYEFDKRRWRTQRVDLRRGWQRV